MSLTAEVVVMEQNGRVLQSPSPTVRARPSVSDVLTAPLSQVDAAPVDNVVTYLQSSSDNAMDKCRRIP